MDLRWIAVTEPDAFGSGFFLIRSSLGKGNASCSFVIIRGGRELYPVLAVAVLVVVQLSGEEGDFF